MKIYATSDKDVIRQAATERYQLKSAIHNTFYWHVIRRFRQQLFCLLKHKLDYYSIQC